MGTTQATWQNQKVTITRTAKQGDKDFKPAGGEQVVVKLPDGSERTVPSSRSMEIT